jgi:hypothetical protein
MMTKEIFYDRQFRCWIGVILDKEGNQVGDCEYFPTKDLARKWMFLLA